MNIRPRRVAAVVATALVAAIPTVGVSVASAADTTTPPAAAAAEPATEPAVDPAATDGTAADPTAADPAATETPTDPAAADAASGELPYTGLGLNLVGALGAALVVLGMLVSLRASRVAFEGSRD